VSRGQTFSGILAHENLRPGIYPKNMKLDSKTASFYHSRPSKWLSGRQAIVPCANILGGGSSINFVSCYIPYFHKMLTPTICYADDVHPSLSL